MDRNVDLRSPSKKAISVDHFPDEIVADILMRLPVKSIVKFTRVCKSWNSLIKSRTFIDAYLRRLLTQSKHENNKDGRRQLLLLKKNGPQDPEHLMVSFDSSIELFHEIAMPEDFGKTGQRICPEQTYFFGYDCRTNDYKVLRIVSISRHVKIEVYSLAKGYWKSPRSSFPALAVHVFENVFVNGALHWILPRDRNLDEYLIVSFDLGAELFHKITMPEALRKKGSNCYVLRRGESLALIEIESTFLDNERHFVHQLHLWVMKEYGDVKSWIKLDSVGLQGIDRPRPLCFKSRDELVITMFDCNRQQTAVVVDMAKETATRQEHCYSSSMDPFVENLVLLNHPNALSY
ncbi:hypothetical protein C1H46_041415 [Malus baccata]|uniref:F-box domain-containing protein n=1 Tax=Malus baccata TaxID=106549 RepID=A0A540KGF4_MALBA|nr:hypothetical protein C1H46_041413 [Malus baccata]TQD73064.1 hypothetical protein C1H46_041415 [Malus baccata]